MNSRGLHTGVGIVKTAAFRKTKLCMFLFSLGVNSALRTGILSGDWGPLLIVSIK